MKYLNILVIIFFIPFNACKQDSVPIDYFPVVQKIVNYDSIYSDKNDIIGAVSNMEIVDNVIITQSLNDDYFFSFIDVDKGKLLTKWGVQGHKQGEYVRIAPYFTVCDNHLIFADNTRNELNYVPLSAILEQDSAAKIVTKSYPYTVDFRPRNAVVVGDKKIVTGALKNGHFGIIDSANRIIKHPFDYPFPYSGVEGIYRSIVFYSLLKPNNRQRKFALSILWSDIFEIYQVNDTNVTRTFLSSFNHIPKVRERQGGRLPSHTPDYDNNIVGLDKMAVSENLICFVYSSEGYEKWKKLVDASNEILCFDWNGNKVKKYVLPFPIHRFCIDDKHIYGLRYFSDSETIIYRFNMDL